jgi:hypothetical protein
VVTGQTHTINFQDFAVSRASEDFYAAVMANPADFSFAWLDCDGNLYGIQQSASGEYTFTPGTITVDHIIPQSNQESQNFNGVVTMQFRGIFKSYRADAFVNLLLANQDNGCDPYYSPTERECVAE